MDTEKMEADIAETEAQAKIAAKAMFEVAAAWQPHVLLAALAMMVASSAVITSEHLPIEKYLEAFNLGVNSYIKCLLGQEKVRAAIKLMGDMKEKN